jgi:hypothetical protein
MPGVFALVPPKGFLVVYEHMESDSHSSFDESQMEATDLCT